MAFASSDMAHAQDAAPREFTVCEDCGQKGRYQRSVVIGSVLYTYSRCRYCSHSKLIGEKKLASP